MEFAIVFFGLITLGFIMGYLVCDSLQTKPSVMGKILMDRSDDPDEAPYMIVELYDRPEALYGHEQVLFDVAQK